MAESVPDPFPGRLSGAELLAAAECGSRPRPAALVGPGGRVACASPLAQAERIAEPGRRLEWVQAPDGRRAVRAPLRPGQLFAVTWIEPGGLRERMATFHPVPAARLRVSLLGGLTLRSTPSRQVLHHGPFPTRALELMTLLALRSVDGPASRAELAEALWPADAPASRKQNLKQVLRRVRKRWESETGDAGGAPFDVSAGGLLRACPAAFSCDVAEIVQADRLAASLQDAGDHDGAYAAAAAAFSGAMSVPRRGLNSADLARLPWLEEARVMLERSASSLAGLLVASPLASEAMRREAAWLALQHAPCSARAIALSVQAAVSGGLPAARRVYQDVYVPSVADPAPFGVIAGAGPS